MDNLRAEIRNLMQDMLLKKNFSSEEEFQHWWIDEGNEKRYFALQGRLEELEEEERRKSCCYSLTGWIRNEYRAESSFI